MPQENCFFITHTFWSLFLVSNYICIGIQFST